jgi:hypothetical protein
MSLTLTNDIDGRRNHRQPPPPPSSPPPAPVEIVRVDLHSIQLDISKNGSLTTTSARLANLAVSDLYQQAGAGFSCLVASSDPDTDAAPDDVADLVKITTCAPPSPST